MVDLAEEQRLQEQITKEQDAKFPVELATEGSKYSPLDGVKRIVKPEVKGVSLLSVVENMGPSIDEETYKKRAVELSFIKTALDPLTGPEQAYNDALRELKSVSDPDMVFESYQAKYADQQKKRILEVANANHISGNWSTQDAADIVRAGAEVDKLYQGDVGKERLLAETYANADYDQAMLDEKVAFNHAWSKLDKLKKGQGFGETTLNVLGLFVPDFTKDSNDLTGNGLFKTKSDLMRIVFDYQSTPAQDKPEKFDQLFEQAVEAYDSNPFKLAGFITMLHGNDPSVDFNIGVAFDALDIGLSGTVTKSIGFASKVSKAHKAGTQLTAKMKELGAVDQAAALNMLSEAASAKVPAKAGAATKLDAAMTASPYKFEDFIMGITSNDGLAGRIRTIKDEALLKLKADIENTVQKPFEEIRQSDYLATLGPLNETEQAAAIKRFSEARKADIEGKGVAYEEVGVVFSNQKGFIFEYKIAGSTARETVHWTKNDVGTFEGINTAVKKYLLSNDRFFSSILSPEMKLRGIMDTVVSDLTFGGHQASRMKKDLSLIAKKLDEGLSKKERVAVSELLIAGDETKTVFSLDQLRNKGVELASGTRTYTDKEIANYYKKVAFHQELWSLRNATTKRELEFLGAKEIRYTHGDGEEVKVLGIPKKNFQGVDATGDSLILTPNMNKSGYSEYRTLAKDKLTEEGYHLVELVEPYMINDKKVKYALIKNEGSAGKTSINRLPDEVLHRIPGYVPRNYKPGYYFVKDINTGKTVRAFENKAKAEAWKASEMSRLESMTKEEREALGIQAKTNYQVLRDRELNLMEALSEDANAYGGLYTGARKTDSLLLNDEGKRLERLDWGDSMQRYIDSVSDVMPLNEYRMALKERWINTVNEIAKMEGKPFGIDPNADWKTAQILVNSDPRLRQALENSRDYLRQQFSMWSDEEKSLNGWMMDLAERMSGNHPKFERALIALSHSEPMKQLTAATFHAHLGWFNPRQLYIQAQNAILAISANPTYGLQASTKAAIMQTLLRLPDDAMVAAINKLGKLPGVDSDDLIESIRLFRRSGMESSITRVADYNAAVEGITPGAINSIRNAAKKGLIFYEQGELFARLVSFNIAHAKLYGKQAGKRLDDTALKAIADEAFRMHMNLQRENAAKWQQNILRLPTQFFQVQAKIVEKMIPAILFGRTSKSGWTRAEAAKVFAGQIAFYGMLGTPFHEEVFAALSEQTGMSVKELQEEHPLAMEALIDGINGMLFEVLGFQNQFGGDTASLWASMDDNIVAELVKIGSAMVNGDFAQENLQDLFAGPSLNVIKKGKDALGNTWDSLKVLWAVPTPEQMGLAAVQFANDFGRITSTWSNLEKARYLLENGHIYTNNNNILVGEGNVEGLNYRTIVARAMGMPTDLEAATYALKMSNKERSLYLSRIRKAFKEAAWMHYKSPNEERFHALKGMLLNGLSPLEKKEILDGVANDLISTHQKSELDKELAKFVEQTIRGQGRIPENLGLSNIFQAEQPQKEAGND